MNDRFETKSPNAKCAVRALKCLQQCAWDYKIREVFFSPKMVHKNHSSKQATDGTNVISFFCETLQIQGSYLVITEYYFSVMLLNNTVVQYERVRRLLKQRRLLFTCEITGGDNTVKNCLNILYSVCKYIT